MRQPRRENPADHRFPPPVGIPGRLSGVLSVGLAAVLALALGACSSSGSGSAKGNDRVEVISSWVGTSSETAFESIVDEFNRVNPGIEFVDASVEGGFGGNAQNVLDTRLQANNPPDSYQLRVGQELASDVKSGRVYPLDDLYTRNGWREKLPDELLAAVTHDGKIYAVPVAVHRVNLLWFNPKVLARVGISGPPETWEEFRIQAGKFRQAGITPLAVGPAISRRAVLEAVLLGELGPDVYAGLWNGTSDWNSPQVKSALISSTLVFSESDASTVSGDWTEAMNKVVKSPDNPAAYTITGSWAYARNLEQGLKLGTDFGVVPTPGSKGIFAYTAEAFAMLTAAPHPAAAKLWITECGSVTAQDRFGPQAGALPARTDASSSLYTGYLADSLAEWRSPNSRIVGSMAFGVAVNRAFAAEIDGLIARFIDDHDSENFVSAVIKAYEATK